MVLDWRVMVKSVVRAVVNIKKASIALNIILLLCAANKNNPLLPNPKHNTVNHKYEPRISVTVDLK